jgi:hypothetical protein
MLGEKGRSMLRPYKRKSPEKIGAHFYTSVTIPENKILSRKIFHFLKDFFSLLFSARWGPQEFDRAMGQNQETAKVFLN